MATIPETTHVLEWLMDPLARCFTAEVARQVIALRADEEIQARLDQLAEKATAGTLSEGERAEYAAYVSAIDFISILQAKSRHILTRGA